MGSPKKKNTSPARPPRPPRRHIVGLARPAPPVLVSVRKNTLPLFHATFVARLLSNNLGDSCFNPLTREKLFPCGYRLFILWYRTIYGTGIHGHVELRGVDADFCRKEFKEPCELLLLEVVAE